MRLWKKAFCLPSAWIQQEENLWSKLLLILLCSKERWLLHGCVLYSYNTVSPHKNVSKSQGLVGERPKMLRGEGVHCEQAWSSAGSSAAPRPALGMPTETMLLWDHTSSSTRCRRQGEGQQQPLLRDPPSPDTKQCLILVLFLNRCCLAYRTALWLGWESRKTSRTTV